MKKEIYVRFANDGTYYNKIKVSLDKIKNPKVYNDEVFCTIDGITVAMKRSDWDELQNNKVLENN
jgi:hypothetical protein